ncbi:MAG: hypothetical protein DRP11_04265 [Candidatus Aenigmatarchaeota archaeon]|nr:MAG: hypothetical protein DRP11_04265 [Candidatus Aenigmarchaeota archaeon]
MDFARTLIVGLVILAAMFILLGGFAPEEKGYRFGLERNITYEEEKPKLEGEFFVGSRDVTDFDHIYLNEGNSFDVSYAYEDKVFIEEKDIEVRHGLTEYKYKELAFTIPREDLPDMKNPYLEIKVSNTNLYGELRIFLNGEEVFSDFIQPRATEMIELNRSLLKEENTLRIEPTSSGWRFWASDVYQINYIRVGGKVLGLIQESYTFSLDREQYRNFQQGRLILNSERTRGEGELSIMLNGKEIFKGIPEPYQWIDFRDVPMFSENIITFLTGKDTSYHINKAELVIFWEREAHSEVRKTITTSSYDYSRLPGSITFKVNKIYGTPGPLNIKIIDSLGREHKLVVEGIIKEGGTVTVPITKDDLTVGTNTVVFSVSGRGGYSLYDFRVNY